MRHRRLLLPLAAALVTLSCANPSTAPGGGGSPAPATGQAGNNPAPGQAQDANAPWRAAAVPDAAVSAFTVKTVPEAGGAVFADLDRDTDPYDAFDPHVPVIFGGAGYPAADAVNGKISVRGKSTRQAQLKSYRIELKKDAPSWNGYQDVLLNKHAYDFTRLRNRLAFDIFKRLPELVSSDVSFATLSVDGQDKGFYTQIERLDKRFLARHGLDPQGYLYKAENFEWYRYPEVLKDVSDPGYDEAAFEKRLEIAGPQKDHKRLLEMLDAVNDESRPINDVIATYFDRRNYVTWLALEAITDNLDTNSQNFYLYAPASGGKWQFIPWDYDGGLGFFDQDARRGVARWEEGPGNWWGCVLHKRFMADPNNMKELEARVTDLMTQIFNRRDVDAYLNAYRPAVAAAIAKEPDAAQMRDAGCPPEQWAQWVDQIDGVFQASHDRFLAGLKRPMPIFLDSTVQDDQGVHFAWDPAVDLQGDAVTYDLKVASDQGLQNVVFEQKGLTVTEVDKVLPAGRYFWTVVTRDATGEWQIPFTSVELPGDVNPTWGVEMVEVQ